MRFLSTSFSFSRDFSSMLLSSVDSLPLAPILFICSGSLIISLSIYLVIYVWIPPGTSLDADCYDFSVSSFTIGATLFLTGFLFVLFGCILRVIYIVIRSMIGVYFLRCGLVCGSGIDDMLALKPYWRISDIECDRWFFASVAHWRMWFSCDFIHDLSSLTG